MTHVVVAAPLGKSRAQREDRRGAVEGLDLGLLVDAEHQGSVGRIEVKPDDVAHLLDEQRVRELEGVDEMGFEPEGPPDAAIADWLMPVAFAIERVDQWVASTGISSKVFTITASTGRRSPCALHPGVDHRRARPCAPQQSVAAICPPSLISTWGASWATTLIIETVELHARTIRQRSASD